MLHQRKQQYKIYLNHDHRRLIGTPSGNLRQVQEYNGKEKQRLYGRQNRQGYIRQLQGRTNT